MIEVVAIRLNQGSEALRAMWEVLTDAERRRAVRLRFERDRRRFIVARARLRELLAERLGAGPRTLELVSGPGGKPGLAPKLAASGWRFNIAHCEELALCAFSRGRELGIDLEAIRPVSEADAIAERFFAPGERRDYSLLSSRERALGFLRLWTRKEALAKGLGSGLCAPLETLDASAPPPGWTIDSFTPERGFVAALAVEPQHD
jgi:4'-phosphopantetheinyl transferase